MYSKDGSSEEACSSSESSSFSDEEESLESEISQHTGDEDGYERDSSSERQAELEDELTLWNPREIDAKDIPGEKPDIKDMIKKYITDAKNADCVVTVCGKEFRCHKLLLQCYSSYFKRCSSNCMELNFPFLTADMFSELYAWMYGPQFSYKRILQPKTILDVLVVSVDLGIRELEEQCWAVFNSKHVFNEATAYSMFLEAKLKSCDMVADIMLPRVTQFFLQLAGSDEFLRLPVGHVIDILDSAHISVPSEADVFTAALRWLAHDWDCRAVHAARIMACIRFQCITPLELVVIRRCRHNSVLLSVVDIPEVRSMMDEGLQYAVLLACRPPTLHVDDLLEHLGFQRPRQRQYSCGDGQHGGMRSILLDDFIHSAGSQSNSSAKPSCFLSSHSANSESTSNNLESARRI